MLGSLLYQALVMEDDTWENTVKTETWFLVYRYHSDFESILTRNDLCILRSESQKM